MVARGGNILFVNFYLSKIFLKKSLKNNNLKKYLKVTKLIP